jgi:hypothetical protein
MPAGPCGAQDEFLLVATAQNLRKPAKLVLPIGPRVTPIARRRRRRSPYRDPDIIKQTLVAVAANPSPDIFNEICQQETFRSHTIAHARSSMGDGWFPRKAVVGRYLAIVKSGQFSDLAVTAQWDAVCRVNSANS